MKRIIFDNSWAKYTDFKIEEENDVDKKRKENKTIEKCTSTALTEIEQEALERSEELRREIENLFKVDFKELGRRLKRVPLHERLDISTKYFEKDLLALIVQDARRQEENAKHDTDIVCINDNHGSNL